MPVVQMIMFPGEYRCFKPMATILFNPGVNLLVGSNGSGKSTVLGALCAHGGLKNAFWRASFDLKKVSVMLMSKDGPKMRAFAHDFENDSPRTSPSMDIHGMLPFESILSHGRMSHGQSTLDIIRAMESATEPGIVVLDEPDTGLAPGAVKKLVRAIKHLESIGSQVIAAVHNPWLIEEFQEVWDMEKLAFRPSKEYLDEQRNNT